MLWVLEVAASIFESRYNIQSGWWATGLCFTDTWACCLLCTLLWWTIWSCCNVPWIIIANLCCTYTYQSIFRSLIWYIFHDSRKRIFWNTTWLSIQVFLKLWKFLQMGQHLVIVSFFGQSETQSHFLQLNSNSKNCYFRSACTQQRMCGSNLRLLSVSSCKLVLGSMVAAR